MFFFPYNNYYSQSFYDGVNAANMTVLMVLHAFKGSYLRSFVRVELTLLQWEGKEWQIT